MLSSRQQAYLQAMDIPVWRLRTSASAAPSEASTAAVSSGPAPATKLRLGPGSGGVLLVCGADHETAGRLANDIVRVLSGSPVWAWPVETGEAAGLDNAVEEHLFTTVAFFGTQLAARFFAGEPPAHVRTAQLVVLPAMQDLQVSAEARRALWAGLCKSGMTGKG